MGSTLLKDGLWSCAHALKWRQDGLSYFRIIEVAPLAPVGLRLFSVHR
jgi:hypothetical protein